MTIHLYGETLQDYVARELPSETLATIDAHVSNCLLCAHALAEEDLLSDEWERRGWLGRLVRTEAPSRLETGVEDSQAQAA
jgi:hypothetical protein